jgi:adenylate cyclase
MGDELMIHAEDAGAAVRLATCVVCEIGAQHGFPTIRIGVHTGPAVERDGDWFGSAVNLAARIAAMATGGEILLSDQTREAAGEIEGIDLEQRGRRELRAVGEPVLLHAAVRSSERSQRGLPIDPVCRMAVDPEHCAGSLQHGGGRTIRPRREARSRSHDRTATRPLPSRPFRGPAPGSRGPRQARLARTAAELAWP